MLFSSTLAASALALLPLLSAASPFPSAKHSPPVPSNTTEYYALGCPNTTCPYATEAEQLEAAQNFAELLFVEKRISDAFNGYIAQDLINHAPDVPADGAAVAEQTVTGLLSVATIDIQFVHVGQGYSTTFFKATTPQGVAASMEVFRMDGTCLVEHWVVLQPVTNSSNPHPYF